MGKGSSLQHQFEALHLCLVILTGVGVALLGVATLVDRDSRVARSKSAALDVEVELEDGNDQVGFVENTVFTLTARVKISPADRKVAAMRYDSGFASCRFFDDLDRVAWSDQVSTTLAVTGWTRSGIHGFVTAVQVRDDAGDVSSVGCDEINVEGNLPPPDPEPTAQTSATSTPAATPNPSVTASPSPTPAPFQTISPTVSPGTIRSLLYLVRVCASGC